MNVSIKKKIRDRSPEVVKYLFKSVIRNRLIHNPFFKQYSRLLADRTLMTGQEILDFQFSELKNLLIFSQENIPYYRKTFQEYGFDAARFSSFDQIQLLPIIDKETLRENFRHFQTEKPVPGGYYLAFTGGTSGYPLKLHLDYASVFKELAFVYHQRKILGYELTDKLATFRGVEFGKKLWLYHPMYNELIFSPFALNKDNVRSYLERFNKYAPDFLNGYHSAIYHFASLLKEQGLSIKKCVKGIFLASENIDPMKREFIEEFFGCPSTTFYGHSEKAVFASERERGSFEFDPFYGYSEFIEDKETSESLIVTTGLLNRSMPLIRYNTFDKCERVSAEKFTITGRWNADDCLTGRRGEKTSHVSFNFHSGIFQNVKDYQFIQTEKGRVTLILQTNEKFHTSEVSKMKTEFARKVGGILDFDIRVNAPFRLTSRGKFNRIVKTLP